MKNKSKKKFALLFVIVTQLAIPIHSTFAQDYYNKSELLPYFRLDFGKSKFINVSGSPDVAKGKKLDSDINSIFSAGVGIGINLGDKLRSDITWVHHLYPVLRARENSYSIKRMPKIDSYFFNLYYEIGSRISVFNPYLGGGIGFARISDRLYTSNIDNGALYRDSHTINRKSNFAYKFVFGSSFDLNESVKFDLEYNYHDYGKTKATLNKKNNQIGTTHYRAHCLNFGLRFGV